MQLVLLSAPYLKWVNTGFNVAVGFRVNSNLARMTVGDGQLSIDDINDKTNSTRSVTARSHCSTPGWTG